MVGKPALLALDWGSTSLRAFLMDGAGAVLAERASEDGASRITGGAEAFEQALRRVAGEWLQPDLPVWACGMVGSQHGWREAPYAECPVALQELSRGAVRADGSEGLRVRIVPGVCWRSGQDGADVMRGEEIQVAGLLATQLSLAARCRIVLPGTHSKWVEVRDGRILSFRTFMTGELFAVLKQHSVLGRLMASSTTFHAEAFDEGLTRARMAAGRGLSGDLFSTRARVLLGQLQAEHSADYLSGLLVGHELAAALPATDADEPLALIGDPALCARYAHALQAFGRPAAAVAGNTAPQGLWALACA
ncbi:2-dehydro-3-deoxygalactonokinase [Ramlibacter sp. G-1-2-2]|uniref:2-dehydro-3-deoxygalactonokinase n=1 Tax=Ramlibacter agri TaxID=2728837 RepID=A0A848GY47_9BURK|nr:2-dehydro-3-deoxygalactonokinase [Ramlibacter agri]NML43264.1 2-dehydro-3-deoxygalactonokinase [Ramlibacter agri]